jgi:Fe-S-cluster-containing dehydrogenase component
MTRYGMVIDPSRCIGCYNCFLSCRDEHVGNDHRPVAMRQPDSGRNWIDIRTQERGSFPKIKVSYVPVLCQQCADAPCISAGQSGAVYRREDGIIVIDSEKAVGQRQIVSSCPYNAIVWNTASNIPQKCTFCAHLLDDGWTEPRCVEACPTRALVFGDIADPASDVAKLKATVETEVLDGHDDLQPTVTYVGLPKRFAAGDVVFADRTDVAAEGIDVTLQQSDRIFTVVTDNYGDFEFEGLEADADYVLIIAHPGYAPRKLTLSTRTDLNLGSIVLEPLASATAG